MCLVSRHHVCFHFRGTGEVFIIQGEEKGGVEGLGVGVGGGSGRRVGGVSKERDKGVL